MKGDNGDERTTYLVLVKGTTEMKELRTSFLWKGDNGDERTTYLVLVEGGQRR